MTIQTFSRLGIFLLAFLAAASPGTVQITKSTTGTDYLFIVDRVTLDPAETFEGETFIKVRFDGITGFEGLVADEGKPEIPAIRFYVDGDGAIVVSEGERDGVWGGSSNRGRVRPYQPSQPKRYTVPPVPVLDRAAYQSTELFPKELYTVEKVGYIKGRLRRLVSLYPIRYEAAANRFETIRKFHVHVSPLTSPPALSGAKTLAVVVGSVFASSPALESYLAFKKSEGFQIARLDFGRDVKTNLELRDALRVLYAKPGVRLTEAMIIGDNEDVPGYTTSLLSGVTDHFLRCLDGTDYLADLGTPDISVGRFAVHTEAELAAVVAKQIKYQQGAFIDKSWISKFSFIATDDESHYQVAEASFDYLTSRYTGPLGFLGTFPILEQVGGDLLYAIRYKAQSSQVLERLREGRGFINYGGHGGPDSWLGPEITADDVKSLQPKEATPFVMANACDTGKFTKDSFAETWLRHPTGAVAYWGSMDSTYWDEDDLLQRKVYDQMFRDRNLELGEFTDAGLAEVWRYYGGRNRSKYYWETYVVFGDPSLNIRLNP